MAVEKAPLYTNKIKFYAIEIYQTGGLVKISYAEKLA
jgi:hypothetical protein